MGPGEEASEDTTEESAKNVDLADVIEDSAGSEELDGHDMVGDTDSGVDSSSGVGASDEDHSSESHGDGHASKESSVFLSVSSESKSGGVLADEVGHGEDERAHGLDGESLSPVSGLRDEMGELSSTLDSAILHISYKAVDGQDSADSSKHLGRDKE